jgi:hypothetical protein
MTVDAFPEGVDPQREKILGPGRFSIAMFAGRTSKVKAEESFPPIGTAEVRVSLDAGVTGLRVILVPPRHRPR